jgi:hypothetical protein
LIVNISYSEKILNVNEKKYHLPVSKDDYDQFKIEADELLKEFFHNVGIPGIKKLTYIEKPDERSKYYDEVMDYWVNTVKGRQKKDLCGKAFFYNKLFRLPFIQKIVKWLKSLNHIEMLNDYENIEIEQIIRQLEEAERSKDKDTIYDSITVIEETEQKWLFDIGFLDILTGKGNPELFGWDEIKNNLDDILNHVKKKEETNP